LSCFKIYYKSIQFIRIFSLYGQIKMEPFQTIQINHINDEQIKAKQMAVTTEFLLKICIDNYFLDELMRTPGDEKAHVVGLLNSYQMISSIDDLKSFSITTSDNFDTATVSLKHPFSFSLLNKKYSSDPITKIPIDKPLTYGEVHTCIDDLRNCQPLRSHTKSTHAAILFDKDLTRLASKEDIGRHNALDKVIGQTMLDQTIDKASILVLSSRVSHELMIKIIQTPVRYILSVSRPTSLAVELAHQHSIHLACLSKKGGILVFNGMHGFCKRK